MSEKEKPDLRLAVRIDDSDRSYLIIKASVARWDADRQELSGLYASGSDFEDLEVSGYCDSDAHWYGWSCEYRQVYSVDLRRAQRMVNGLTKIERHLTRLEAKFGYARDLHAYMVRVANALGVTHDNPFVVRGQNGDRWVDAKGLSYWLDDQGKQWRVRHGHEAE